MCVAALYQAEPHEDGAIFDAQSATPKNCHSKVKTSHRFPKITQYFHMNLAITGRGTILKTLQRSYSYILYRYSEVKYNKIISFKAIQRVLAELRTLK